MRKKINFILCSFFSISFVSCQNLNIKSDRILTPHQEQDPTKVSQPNTSTEQIDKPLSSGQTQEPEFSNKKEPQPIVITKAPKVGLILGAGGAKSFAHISVLQEIQKNRIPIQAIVGIEFSALAAALYAQNQSANEVEWQMNKIKPNEFIKNSLINSSNTLSMGVLSDFLSDTVSRKSTERSQVPFACPSFNLNKNQVFMMSKGSLDQLLPFCMVYPPLFSIYQGSVAGVDKIKQSVDWLKQQGAQFIVYVDVSSQHSGNYWNQGSISDEVLWREQILRTNKISGVDMVISIPIGRFKMDEFQNKREISTLANDSIIRQVNLLAKKLGY